ncbi:MULTISPECIES: hypothetical protein [unclassified Paenibacillus]|uniref:hypothetical protein n=1 Tax=unclassified Paenibacillus TaxID=185978 RepID=UPI0036389FC3
MKTVLQTILGLIIDDWWLAIGILLSITVTSIFIYNNFSSAAGAWLLAILTLLTLPLSLVMEYRKKMR